MPLAAIPLFAALCPALVVGLFVMLKRTIGDRRTERAMRKELATRLANHRALLTEHPPVEPHVVPRAAAVGE